MPDYVLRSVCVDCRSPLTLARFWAGVLGHGWNVRDGSDDDGAVVDPPDRETPGRVLPNIWFNPVPDPTPGKSKLHLDVNVSSADEVARIVELGATVVREPVEGENWHVLADPEGNQFCVMVVPPAG